LIVLALFFPSELITGFLVCLKVVLEGGRHASWVACADVECRVCDMSSEGLAYLGIYNVRRGHEVLKEVGGDVVLVGEYVP
jgi:hypothetical protein